MNDQEQVTQLSALFDGELPPQQAEMVMRRALKDATLRTSWGRYALIGACVRGEPLPVRQGMSVADRVQAALAAERDLNVTALPARGTRGETGRSGGGASWISRGALGGAIAAGVAVISVFVVRQMAPVTDGSAMLAQADIEVPAVSAGAQADLEPAGYTTPGENSPAQRRTVDASLGHYLVAHSEEAASALRSSFDLGQDGVVLTDDQISALR